MRIPRLTYYYVKYLTGDLVYEQICDGRALAVNVLALQRTFPSPKRRHKRLIAGHGAHRFYFVPLAEIRNIAPSTRGAGQ